MDVHGRRFKGLEAFAGERFHPPLTDATVGVYTIASRLDCLLPRAQRRLGVRYALHGLSRRARWRSCRRVNFATMLEADVPVVVPHTGLVSG
ncbi:MAG: hypothetical protein M3214_11995, partial [Actinomycetota bacterium]|nr:hypothetical protein [Actinomycetota bacterium]